MSRFPLAGRELVKQLESAPKSKSLTAVVKGISHIHASTDSLRVTYKVSQVRELLLSQHPEAVESMLYPAALSLQLYALIHSICY